VSPHVRACSPKTSQIANIPSTEGFSPFSDAPQIHGINGLPKTLFGGRVFKSDTCVAFGGFAWASPKKCKFALFLDLGKFPS
jgi:hypothetical protein